MKNLVLASLVLIIAVSCNKDAVINEALIFATSDGKIVKINADGSGKTVLVSADYNWIITGPVNSKFVYNKHTPANESVFLYDLNANTSTKIIEENSNFEYKGISLSHSGDKILLRVFDKISREQNIGIIDIDGSNLQLLTTGQDIYKSVPVFSPDDSKIAFYSNQNLCVVNSDGSNLQKIDSMTVYGDSNGLYIDWSPDGNKIVYLTNITNDQERMRNLNTINFDGSNKTTLTSGTLLYDPIWSNDNSKIIFSGNTTGDEFANIYSINSNGSGLTNLTNRTAVDRYYSSPEYNPENTQLCFTEAYYDPDRVDDNEVIISLYVLNTTNNSLSMISSNDLAYPYKAYWIK